jgi:hypothetical protein
MLKMKRVIFLFTLLFAVCFVSNANQPPTTLIVADYASVNRFTEAFGSANVAFEYSFSSIADAIVPVKCEADFGNSVLMNVFIVDNVYSCYAVKGEIFRPPADSFLKLYNTSKSKKKNIYRNMCDQIIFLKVPYNRRVPL